MISLEAGTFQPLQFTWPIEELDQADAIVSQAVLIMQRQGGLLLGLPVGYIPVEALQQASAAGDGMLGPHTNLVVSAFREDGQALPAGCEIDVLVVDMSEEVAAALVPLNLDGVTVSFHDDANIVPDPQALLQMAREWLSLQAAPAAAFYSAEEAVPETPLVEEEEEEEGKGPAPKPAKAPGQKAKRVTTATLAEQLGSMSQLLPALADRLDALQRTQETMRQQMEGQQHIVPPRPSQQPVSTSLQDFAKMMGSPPRVKVSAVAPTPIKSPLVPQMDSGLSLQEQAEEESQPGGGSTLAQAVLEQSRALTTLVAQLNGGDPLLDSHASHSGISLSSKGSAGRQQLQTELANRSGQFFLQVTQNAARRMRPSMKAPADIAAAASSDFSMVNYLERFGGYGGCREMGLVQFCLAHIFDAALHSDWAGVRDHLALTMTAVEQAVQDSNRWDLAYQLTLLEDPPSQLWAYRGGGSMNPRLRAFAPLFPQKWATIALAYLKEVDYIQSRRQDLKKNPTPPPPAPTPSPKRKTRQRGKNTQEEAPDPA